MSDGAAPDVLAPPPRLFLAAWAVGAGLSVCRSVPLMEGGWWALAASGRWGVAVTLIVLGLAVAAGAFRTLRRHGTSPDPRRAASALVIGGPFAWSRNPVYVAMVLIYLGATAALDRSGPLLTLPLLLVVMEWGVVRREERHLAERFGSAYEDYRRRVRRWI